MAVTVEMAVLAAPLVMLVPPQVDPQEQQELRGSPAMVAMAVSAALLRTHYPATVEPAAQPLPETVATAEQVALQPGLHRAMHSVVKVALEVLSVPARVTVVEVVPVAQRPKRLSTAMQPAARVESEVWRPVALAMVVSLVPVAPR